MSKYRAVCVGIRRQRMETESPTSPAAGASKFLANLPNGGFLSYTTPPANPGGMRVYLCDHDTSPPVNQLIKTNQMNILIRSLVLKKQKGESCSKDAKGTRKRVAERAADFRSSMKRAMPCTQSSSRQEGTKAHAPEKNFQSLTVERLRVLLKEKGLPLRGKKDELIARLRSVDG